jgi:hypothetical protein
MQTETPAFVSIRRTDEDAANLAEIAAALRPILRKPFVTASNVVRTALRVAATSARRGELAEALRRHSADLAQ